MKLIGHDIIDNFKEKNPRSRKSLDAWSAIVRETDFSHHEELRKTFNSVDYAAPDTIFDISGDKYRLITRVVYALRTILVKKVLTHSEYNRWNKK